MSTQGHTPTHTQYSCCVSNPERPELWEQGECSAARHNGVSHSGQNVENTHTHTHSQKRLIAGEDGLMHVTHTHKVRLLLPVPLINLQRAASGTQGSRCHFLPQINTSSLPHTDRLTRAWSVTTTCKYVEIPLRTNLRQSKSKAA